MIEIPTYRWSLPQDTAPLAELIARLERGEMDAVLFTNAEQVRNLFLVSKQNEQGREGAAQPHPGGFDRAGGVGGAARAPACKVGVEASPPKLGALLSARGRCAVK